MIRNFIITRGPTSLIALKMTPSPSAAIAATVSHVDSARWCARRLLEVRASSRNPMMNEVTKRVN